MPSYRKRQTTPLFILMVFFVLFAACSFDYDSVSAPEQTKPDIAMENLEYVRVRGGDPLVRFQADYAERWEESQTMALRNFSFEQMEDSGETINAEGRAGNATVELGSGNVAMSGGIRISIESEDIVINTSVLQWTDKEKTLTGNEEYEVDIERSDGTSFTGRGFFADARNRVWAFSGEVKGRYVEKDDEDEDENLPSDPSETEAPADASYPEDTTWWEEEN